MQETNWREIKPILTWRHYTKDACVEVLRREEASFGDHGPYRWFVYLYLYPDHPRFEQVKNGDWNDLHFNGHVVQWVNWDDDGKNITSIKLGADYMHEWDSDITHSSDDPRPFADANRLIKSLEIDNE